MNKVFVIVESGSSCGGHGDGDSEFPALAQRGSWGWDFQGYYPAFADKDKADQFAKENSQPTKPLFVKELELK